MPERLDGTGKIESMETLTHAYGHLQFVVPLAWAVVRACDVRDTYRYGLFYVQDEFKAARLRQRITSLVLRRGGV